MSEHESDVHVISRAVYRSNDEGYLDPKRHEHIWVLDVPATSDELPKPVQLTSGDYDEGEIVWSRDDSRIYFLTGALTSPITNFRPRRFTPSHRRAERPKNWPLFPWASAISRSARMAASLPSTAR